MGHPREDFVGESCDGILFMQNERSGQRNGHHAAGK